MSAMFTDEFLSTEVVTMIVDEVESRPVSVEERVAKCRQIFGGFFDPQHGKWRSVPYACGRWRLCPLCLADRATVEHQKIALCYEHGEDLRYVELPEDEADDLCAGLGKSNFRRYPGADLDRVFFILGEDDPEVGVEVDDDLFCSLDWKAVVLTPEGRKLSGSLGFVAPGAGSTSQKIKVECVMSDADEHLMKQAYQWAIDQTEHLRPITLAEVESACKTRTYECKSFIVANGARLFPSHMVSVNVDVGHLDWGIGGYTCD